MAGLSDEELKQVKQGFTLFLRQPSKAARLFNRLLDELNDIAKEKGEKKKKETKPAE